MEKCGCTGDDEDEVRDAAHHDHERDQLSDVAGAQKLPELLRSGLKEMRHEQADGVPGKADQDAGAEAPRAVSSRQQENGNVDESLKQVEDAELWDEYSRDGESQEKAYDPDRNAEVCPAGADDRS